MMFAKTFAGATLVFFLGCASADATFVNGMNAFQQGQWQSSIETLQRFREIGCSDTPKDGRCKEAHITIAESCLRLGQARDAYLVLQNTRWDEPQRDDLDERISHLEHLAHEVIASQLRRDPGVGHVGVDFSSQTNGRMRFRKLTLAMDLSPLHGENGHADDTTAAIVIPASPISAGQHVLDVIAFYEGAGSVGPGYRFSKAWDANLTVAAGGSLDVHVRIVESPRWVHWQEALNVTIEVGTGSPPRDAAEKR